VPAKRNLIIEYAACRTKP